MRSVEEAEELILCTNVCKIRYYVCKIHSYVCKIRFYVCKILQNYILYSTSVGVQMSGESHTAVIRNVNIERE